MSNHVHLIVWLTEQSLLSRFMKRVNLAYCRYFQRIYGHSGHLWQARFESLFIDRDDYLLQCGKYIELNPVRAGIVALPEKYRFSSYRYYSLGESDFLLTVDPIYRGLALSEERKRRRYREFVVDRDLFAGDSSDRGDTLVGGTSPLKSARGGEDLFGKLYRYKGSGEFFSKCRCDCLLCVALSKIGKRFCFMIFTEKR